MFVYIYIHACLPNVYIYIYKKNIILLGITWSGPAWGLKLEVCARHGRALPDVIPSFLAMGRALPDSRSPEAMLAQVFIICGNVIQIHSIQVWSGYFGFEVGTPCSNYYFPELRSRMQLPSTPMGFEWDGLTYSNLDGRYTWDNVCVQPLIGCRKASNPFTSIDCSHRDEKWWNLLCFAILLNSRSRYKNKELHNI